jgi:hypothetical protein
LQNTVTARLGSPENAPAEPEATLESLAADVRAKNVLGRSPTLIRLFDVLVEQSLAGRSPKGIEMAEAVLGPRASFDLSSDTSVRVYAHRLRKKLDDYYGVASRAGEPRLSLCRGEYRLIVEFPDSTGVGSAIDSAAREASQGRGSPASKGPQTRRPWGVGRRTILLAMAALLMVNGGGWAALLLRSSASAPPARSLPPWSLLSASKLPTIIVLGDYYIFGDTDNTMEVKRLIRDFSINSRLDLDQFLMNHPEMMERYTDVDLHYLPVSAAPALQSLLPLIVRPSTSMPRPRIFMASDVTPEVLKHNNVVYIGYLSGLNVLRDPVFSGSRFRPGSTYDELIDTVTHKQYVSEAGSDMPGEGANLDYGYFSTFQGPTGGRIIVIAGTRDIALMETAEAVASKPDLQAVIAKLGGATAFEALFRVEGIERTNLTGRLLVAAPLNGSAIWSSAPGAIHFPVG